MARISVRLTPRGGRDAIDGWVDAGEPQVLRARVAAAPVDGAANEALVRLLAKVAGVAPSDVSIAAGAQGRAKIVEFAPLDDDELRVRIDAHLATQVRRAR